MPARRRRTPPAPRPAYVAYYRVSTEGQERSGLGLADQRMIVRRHVEGVGGKLIAEYTEIVRGWKVDRPELAAALIAARTAGAVLVVAKLDRLARGVRRTLELVDDSGVRFYFCDLPGWGQPGNDPAMDRMMLLQAAGWGEYEMLRHGSRVRGAISARKRATGRSRNGMDNRAVRRAVEKANRGRPAKAVAERERVLKMTAAMRARGKSTADMARVLNAKGERTSGGKAWTGPNLWRVLNTKE